MRLIDANQLKEELTKWFPPFTLEGIEAKTLFKQIIQDIDNAPTVEAYPFEQVQELVKLNQQFAQEIETLKRPQGKWARTGQSFVNPNRFRNFCCSNCFWELDEHIRIEPNFCPNCGAEMKGGAE